MTRDEVYRRQDRRRNIGLALVMLSILAIFAITGFLAHRAEARGKDQPYVPHVIPVPQEHAWCYVLVNENRATGNINMFSCVPK